jgi:ligand-binding sensor domain-containing protein
MQLATTLALALLTNPAPVEGDTEVTRFRAPEGPAADDVRSLLATADGSLWVGTNGGGVSLFDGSEWITFGEDELGLAGVAAMAEGTGGVVWFGGPGGVSRFDPSEGFSSYRAEELGRAIRVAFSVFVDGDGAVWFGTNAGAVRFDGTTWSWTTTAEGLRHDVVHDVHRSTDGSLWFATRRGGLSRLREGTWEHFLTEHNVRGILEDTSGVLWFGTGGGGVHRLEEDLWTEHRQGETVLPLCEDTRGNVWFSRPGAGALRHRAGTWTAHTEHVPGGEIHAAAELGGDRSLWFGADSGLVRLRKTETGR